MSLARPHKRPQPSLAPKVEKDIFQIKQHPPASQKRKSASNHHFHILSAHLICSWHYWYTLNSESLKGKSHCLRIEIAMHISRGNRSNLKERCLVLYESCYILWKILKAKKENQHNCLRKTVGNRSATV